MENGGKMKFVKGKKLVVFGCVLLGLCYVNISANTQVKTKGNIEMSTDVQETGKLSDLRVDQIWLDAQCQINFRLRNAGNNFMPDQEHKEGMVRIYFGKNYEDFYLSKASPKKKTPVDQKGTLKSVGMSLNYNTKIVLTEEINVKAYAGYINKITTADQQRGQSLTLLPLCGIKPKFQPKPEDDEPGVFTKPKIQPKDPGVQVLGTLKALTFWQYQFGCTDSAGGKVEVSPHTVNAVVTITSSDPSTVTVEPTVFGIPAGQTIGTFMVHINGTQVPSNEYKWVTITASYNNVEKYASLGFPGCKINE
ncbi:hypothetical protein ACFLRM_06885 [Acidobacteriota bacterium]